MPRGDGTGPMGMGPMTGRGMGYCAGYRAPGFASGGFGRGMGRGGGRGFGFGFRRGGGYGFAPPFAGTATAIAPDEETVLRTQLGYLEDQLNTIKTRLNELEQSKDNS